MTTETDFTDAHWDTLEAIASGDRTMRMDAQALDDLLKQGYVEQSDAGLVPTQLGRSRFAARFVT